MKKIFHYMFAALVGCATLTSCLDDALETTPTDSMSGESLLGSTSTAMIPLNGIYRSMYATCRLRPMSTKASVSVLTT